MLAKCQASGACHNWEKEKEDNNAMKDKTEIVDNWLPRYTGVPLDQFGEHIPVSYTHLDVYKRQTRHNVTGPAPPLSGCRACDAISGVRRA